MNLLNSRRGLLVIAAMVAAMGTVPGVQAQAKPPVKIAAILPLSGAGTFEGQQGLEGMRVTADMINAKGGIIGGRMIEIIAYDDKSSPEEGVSAARRAIEQDKVDAIVGNMFSPIALAMKEVTRGKIMHMALAPQHPKVTEEGHKWLFRLNETTVMRVESFSKFICEKMNLKSVAILAINDDFGRADAGNFAKWLPQCGLPVKGVEYFQGTDTDFNVQLTKIRGMQPDAIYVAASATSQAAAIYRQARQLGFKGTLIASGGNMNPKLVELSGAAIENVYSISPYVEDADNPVAAAWRTEYNKKDFKNKTSFLSALGAAGLEVVAGAMDKAGSSTDYDKIAAAIRANKWQTVLGEMTFNQIGQGALVSYIVQVKGGKIVTVSRAN